MSVGDFRKQPKALAKGILTMKLNAKERRKPIIPWVKYLLERSERSGYDISCEEIAIVLNNKSITTTTGLKWNARRVEHFIISATKEGEL